MAISAVWIVADGTRSYLQGNPAIPFSTYLFAYSLFLLTHLSLCIGCWHPARQITARDGLVTCLAGTFPERCLGSLRRIRARGEAGDVGDDGLVAVAEEMFLDLDAQEADDGQSSPG